MTRAYRKLSPLTCPSCRKPFRPKNYKSVYCSKNCQIIGRRIAPGSMPVQSKKCTHCLNEQEASGFTKSSKTSDGLQSWCKSCHAERDRTTLIEYHCEDCGRKLTRTTPRHGRKVFSRKLCSKCVRRAIMEANGGRTINWTGSTFFAGKCLAQWKSSANRRRHAWNLTKDDLDRQFILQNGVCALSGIEMIHDKNSPYRPSIDRIDSSLGYTIGNFQFVCSIVNVMKNKIPEPLFMGLCSKITQHRNQVTCRESQACSP
jgi:hypothetical protein